MEDSIQKLFKEAEKYLVQREWEKAIKPLTLIINSSEANQLEKANAYFN